MEIRRGAFLWIDRLLGGGMSRLDQDQGIYGEPPIRRKGIFSSRIRIAPVNGVNSSRDLVFESMDSNISVALARVAIGDRINCDGFIW